VIRRWRSSDYPAMVEEVREKCAALEHVVILGGEGWQALMDAGWQGDPAQLAHLRAALSADDPINIQVSFDHCFAHS
jgi:fatty-acyl-CoA synthase